jgi:hypothetical protein
MSTTSVIAKKKYNLAQKCSHRHITCNDFVNAFKNNMNDPELTQDLFDKYLQFIINDSNSYNSCINTYNNPNANIIINFVENASCIFILNTKFFAHMYQYMSDAKIILIMKYQLVRDPTYMNKLMNFERINYNFTNGLIGAVIVNSVHKKNSTKFVLANISIIQFLSLINKFIININLTNETLIAEHLLNNIEILKTNYLNECIKMIQELNYNSSIIFALYKIVYDKLEKDIILKTFNKAITNFDKNLIMLILETYKDIHIDNSLINILLSNITNASFHTKIAKVADIIDVFILYGLKITKELVIKLLEKKCLINNIEKYNIEINNDILLICSKYSYFPYKFNCKPSLEVLLNECKKSDNLEQIKVLKEYGGVYTTDCLIEACKHLRNGKVIKYLVNECNVKSNNECIKVFQETYKIEALDYIITGYTKSLDTKTENKNSNVELDINSTLIIDPVNITIDMEIDYILKKKIKNLFNYNKKTIKYLTIYELILKYLIDKKLVIGNYFILNNELAIIFKLETCSIFHIDQIKNMITYFITIE